MFNYLHVIDVINATVGAENNDATLEVTYSTAPGTSSLPTPIQATNFTLALHTQPAGIADIHYALELEAAGISAAADQITLDEDSQVNIDVLANDNRPRDVVISADLSAAKQITNARRLITYQAESDANGNDTFEYQIYDHSGELFASNQVTLNITAINDEPVINNIARQVVASGAQVTITASGSDVDGDPLTWSWTQTQGPTVSLSPEGQTLRFTAPNAGTELNLSFSVTASDGLLSSPPTGQCNSESDDSTGQQERRNAVLYLVALDGSPIDKIRRQANKKDHLGI